jgi:hypothetical protein
MTWTGSTAYRIIDTFDEHSVYECLIAELNYTIWIVNNTF